MRVGDGFERHELAFELRELGLGFDSTLKVE